jgi:hypothetical protein
MLGSCDKVIEEVTVSTKGLDALVSHWFTAVEVYEGCVEK